MNTDRMQRVHATFEQALGIPAPQRAAYLEQACGEDAQLRREVEALLCEAEAPSGESFLRPLPFNVKFQIVGDDRDDVMLGRTLGPYAIQQRIGQGGMGNVYLAARVADYQQQVAIKVIKRGMDTEEILRRFRHEMQFSAALSKHANIAALLDAGTTDDGLPYFVMEYVEGDRIDGYCDRRRLRVRDRLELFRQVCAAVQYAHQHTVIHRDLKPSNVLVTEEGMPKLIDFGIAKLTDPEAGLVTVAATETVQPFLTPEYASPEQVRGESLTTATDVYSLGVMLYELLTGRKPYRITSRVPGELRRVIAEEQPQRPSTAVGREETANGNDAGTAELTPQRISDLRGEAPRRLQRTLAGDLDNIVLMALRKEPERRYASVEQFSADIQRYLDGLPVQAQRDTWHYRTGKFIRRHRVGVAAAILVAISLLGGIVGTTTQAIRAAHNASRANQEAARARQLAADEAKARSIADATNAFLVDDIVKGSDPYFYGKYDLQLENVLEAAAVKLKHAFEGQPETKAALHRIVGESLLNLAHYREALEQFELALEIYESLPEYGRYHEDTVETLALKGDALDNIDPFGEAQSVLEEALERAQSTFGEEHLVTITTMARLGETLQTIRKYERAEPLLRRAHELSMRLLDPKDPKRYVALNSLGELCRAQERYAEAEPLREQYLELTTRFLGPEHPSSIGAMNQLASLYYFQAKLAHDGGDDDEEQKRLRMAEPIFKQLVEAAASVLPEDHLSLATYHGNYGVCLAKLGRFDEAEPHVVKAYETSRAAVGNDHDSTEWYVRNAVKFYSHWQSTVTAGEDIEALRGKWEEHFRLCIWLRLLRAEHDSKEDDTPYWWCNDLLAKTDETTAAAMVDRFFDFLLGQVPDDEHRANYLGNLGILLACYGRYDQAEPLLLTSYRQRRDSLGPEHEETQWMIQELAGLYESTGKANEAAKFRAELRAPTNSSSE